MRRVAWTGDPDWRAEVCDLELEADGVRAAGTQLGLETHPYRATYALDARGGWLTRSLRVEVAGVGALELRHDGAGAWEVRTEGDAAGGEAATLAGCLDCDLLGSPLTNLMPVRRHALHERPGGEDFAMAWVSLPDLRVFRDPQRYEHLAPGRVRFTSLDPETPFTADLELDAGGLVLAYPGIARRVSG